jgi:hypothetical protein
VPGEDGLVFVSALALGLVSLMPAGDAWYIAIQNPAIEYYSGRVLFVHLIIVKFV